MGNSVMGRNTYASGIGTIRKYYTTAAWIEGRAETQLDQVAQLEGVREVAAFPDLHPGKYGPVGCAVLSDRVHPHLAGSDIGCGMALFVLDLAPRRIRADKAAQRLRGLGAADDADYREGLEVAGLPTDLFAEALGTIGGGNHFCELQLIANVSDGASNGFGVDQSRAYLLVHSGSRGLGMAILTEVLASGVVTFDSGDAMADGYLARHDQAVSWARLNRQIIAARAAAALKADFALVTDVPHNLITPAGKGWLHRKGAASAGGLVPLAGTRATASYLLQTSGQDPAMLASCAHGAGRRYDRSSMHGRVSAKKSSLQALRQTRHGGRVICDDKALLIEEAPKAYKSAERVLVDLEKLNVAQSIATLQPLVTFKHSKAERRT